MAHTPYTAGKGGTGDILDTDKLVDALNDPDVESLSIDGTLVSSTATELNYLDLTTLGTGAASKAVVLDSGDDYTWPSAGVFTYGVLNDGTTTLGATALEINNACDVSTRIVTVADSTNTISLTAALHANRIVYILDATIVITLPEATGTGDIYTVVLGIAQTASTIVTADTSNAEMRGMLNAFDTDVETTLPSYPAVAGDDTITLNGVSTGGKIYDRFVFTDILTDVWLVSGQISLSGGSEVTPFSSAA